MVLCSSIPCPVMAPGLGIPACQGACGCGCGGNDGAGELAAFQFESNPEREGLACGGPAGITGCRFMSESMPLRAADQLFKAEICSGTSPLSFPCCALNLTNWDFNFTYLLP